MKGIHGTFGVAAAFVILGMLGCDQSKAELEQTKTQLQAVTTERDALKTQVSALQGQVTTLQQQLNDANAKLAAAAAAAQPAQAQHPAAQHRRPSTASTSGTQEPAQTPKPTPDQLEQKAAEKQMTGKASMNN